MLTYPFWIARGIPYRNFWLFFWAGPKETQSITKFLEDLIGKDNKEMIDMSAKHYITKYTNPTQNEVCILMSSASHTKAMGWAEVIDKQEEEAKKIRDQFLTAITDASKPDTTIPLSKFLW